MTPFNPNFLPKGSIAKYHHIGGYGFNIKFWGDTIIQPICVIIFSSLHACKFYFMLDIVNLLDARYFYILINIFNFYSGM